MTVTMKSFVFVSLVVVTSLMLSGSIGSVWADHAPAVPAGSPPVVAAPGAVASLGLGGTPGQPGGIMAFAPFVLMFAVLYFLILRPQQKKLKEQQTMLTSLKAGDDIVTASGLLGKVTGLTEKVVTLEVADGVRIKILKSQVAQIIKGSLKDLDKELAT